MLYIIRYEDEHPDDLFWTSRKAYYHIEKSRSDRRSKEGIYIMEIDNHMIHLDNCIMHPDDPKKHMIYYTYSVASNAVTGVFSSIEDIIDYTRNNSFKGGIDLYIKKLMTPEGRHRNRQKAKRYDRKSHFKY